MTTTVDDDGGGDDIHFDFGCRFAAVAAVQIAVR